ncbi:MAG: CRISPR-associated protein Csx16 [Thermus sp.]
MRKVIVAGTPEMAEALKTLHPEADEVVVGRASPEAVRGAYVYGSLPPDLAAEAVAVESPNFRFGPEDRGKTLSAEDLLARYSGSAVVVSFTEAQLAQSQELRSQGGIYESLARAYEEAKEGADLVLTRHAGLVEYLQRHGVVGEEVQVLEHASPGDVRGKVVAGIVPPHLAQEALAVINPPPVNVPRGQELSADEMEAQLRERGVEPPGTTVAVVRSLEALAQDLARTPVLEGDAPLVRKVEGLKELVTVEVDREALGEARAAWAGELERLKADGHNGFPFPAYQEVDALLEKWDREGRASLAEFQAFRQALDRYPLEALSDGANSWAARVPDEALRLEERLREVLAPEKKEVELG